MTLRQAFEQALARANDQQRSALQNVQGLLTLLPAVADQPVSTLLGRTT